MSTTTTTPTTTLELEHDDVHPVTAVPARPDGVIGWVHRTEERVLDLLAVVGIPILRLALAAVYVVFGGLKIVGLSPVADLVASMLPFLPAQQAVVAMGVFEVVAGALLAFGVLVPWVAAAQGVHLLGTFAVFLVYPTLTFIDGNPLALTVLGEFIAKNIVLVAGLLVVAAFSGSRTPRR